jgi:DNA-binding NarL/FixJ family response regulator
LPAEDVLGELERLVDQSLVVTQNGRFTLLETAHQYAYERPREACALSVLRERHADYYLHFAETAAPEVKRSEQVVWLARLTTEHDNLRAALRWSLEEQRPDVGLRMCMALARFWEVRSHWSEARRWIADLLASAPGASTAESLRASAVGHAGFFATLQGDNEAAQPMLEDGLALARAAADSATQAFTLFGLGGLRKLQGEYAAANSLLQQSLAIARRLGDAWAIARALGELGDTARSTGDFALARLLEEEGVAIARLAGERRIESTLVLGLGFIELWAGDLARASELLEAGLAIKRELDDNFGAASALRGLGLVAYEQSDYVLACQYFREVLAINADMGIFESLPSTLVGLACVASRLGQAKLSVHLQSAAAHAAESAGMALWRYVDERRNAVLEAARASLGADADGVWDEGWALSRQQVEEDAMAVAHKAVRDARLNARQPRPFQRQRRLPDLTDRQVEVLRLVASGKTDRQIAADLMVSDKTVGRHLENIFAKLGISSRAAATAFALRSGIL